MNIANATIAELAGIEPDRSPWRTLRFFSIYRLVVAGVLLAIATFPEGEPTLGAQDPRLFLWICGSYFVAGIALLALLEPWRHHFHAQLTLQVVADILFLALLLYAGGGGKSGLGMLLLIVLAWAGLIGQGRMVLFYAALATVALLLEQGYRVLAHHGEASDFFRAGLTCAGFFGSAIVARLLAHRVILQENLARRRGLELADQIRINERVIRDMQDGVLVIGADGELRQVNPQAANLLGLLPPLALPLPLGAVSPALANARHESDARGRETAVTLDIGATGRAVRARILPRGEGGNSLVFLEDVGRMQQAAQQMKLAALGRLTANMAHEIRNPLAAISHAAELLAEEAPHPAMMRLTRIIGDNARRLDRLVAEVLELGRRDRAQRESLDLAEAVRRLIEELALRDANSSRRIALDIPEGTRICFDRTHLHRVLFNLLDNGLRHAGSGNGAVRIAARTDESVPRVDVRFIDDGPGIDGAMRAQIFEPFFTTRPAGTGLGLYIARELCEANDARLTLRENAPGAQFCLSCATSCPDPNPEPSAA